MYQILVNNKAIRNIKYSKPVTVFEKNEIQKLKRRYAGSMVKCQKTQQLTPIENF